MKPREKIQSLDSELKISVIIPAFNAAAFLSDTLDSLVNQSHVSEILLVDDCSTDDTFQLISHYTQRYSHIHSFQNDVNRGVSFSRNKAIHAATSDWVLFMDADDVATENLCEKLIGKLTHLQSTIPEQPWHLIYPAYLQINQHGNKIEGVIRGRQLDSQDAFGYEILRNLIMSPSGVMVSKQALLDVGGFPVKHHISEDWYLWLKLAQTSAFGYVDEPLVMIRRHSSNTTNYINKVVNAELEVLRNFNLLDIEKAIMRRRETLEQNRADFAAILQRLGYWHKADEVLQSISADKQTEAGWFYKALGAIQSQHWQEAKASLNYLLEGNPNNPSALNNLAILFYMDNEYEKAADLLLYAIGLQPNYLDAKANLSLLESTQIDAINQLKWSTRILRPNLVHYQG